MDTIQYPIHIEPTLRSLPTSIDQCQYFIKEYNEMMKRVHQYDERTAECLTLHFSHIRYRHILLDNLFDCESQAFLAIYEQKLPLMIWHGPARDAYLQELKCFYTSKQLPECETVSDQSLESQDALSSLKECLDDHDHRTVQSLTHLRPLDDCAFTDGGQPVDAEDLTSGDPCDSTDSDSEQNTVLCVQPVSKFVDRDFTQTHDPNSGNSHSVTLELHPYVETIRMRMSHRVPDRLTSVLSYKRGLLPQGRWIDRSVISFVFASSRLIEWLSCDVLVVYKVPHEKGKVKSLFSVSLLAYLRRFALLP